MSVEASNVVTVRTASRDYEVHVGQGLLKTLGQQVAQATRADAAFVVSDTNVAPLYGAVVRDSLERAGLFSGAHAMEAGERNKTFSTLGQVVEAMAEAGLTRDSVVVALGGGVVGDVAGFAAAIYMRGIQVVQVPTTVLAMVDSSVGGKTAVDASRGKNLLGAFLQPSLVIADVGTLATLSGEQFRDGVGEVVKHAVLADEQLFEELSERALLPPCEVADDQRGAHLDYLAHIVATNVRIKRDVVGSDERERGVRQTLNLGHTMGHAIEAASGYTLGHGHCVAAGLCCIARASERLGWSERGLAARIEACTALQGLPTDTSIPHEMLLQQAFFDKKRHGSIINAIIPTRVGAVEIRGVSQREFAHMVELGCGVTC